MARSRRSQPSRRGASFRRAEARIAELRKRRVPVRSTPEDLDGPVDPDLRIDRAGWPYNRLELVIGGEKVSGLGVVDFAQQIGSGVVRMGGIAGVGTHRDHRFCGYSRRVMESSLRWMRSEGLDTSMLYGIPSFYAKFGYAQAFASVSFTMAVRDAEAAPAGAWRFVRFRKEHLPAVLRMYRANNAGRTGPTLRDPKHWTPFRKGIRYDSKAVCKVAIDPRGRAGGYFVYDDTHLTADVIETGFATRAVLPAIVRAAARRAVKCRLERIRFHLPPDDAFIEFCKPLGIRQERTWRRDGGAQVRMIRIPSALAKLGAELAGRMSAPGELTIRTNLDDVHVAWKSGRLAVDAPRRTGPQARMPQWALAQMLYGYRDARALAAEGIVTASARAVATLAEMFPVRPHYHYRVDHF